MAPLHGVQQPQHTTGLPGTMPATPRRRETAADHREHQRSKLAAVQVGAWTHVGTPTSQGQAAGLEKNEATAGTRHSKASEACNLASAELSAPAQPMPSAAVAASVSDAAISAEARQRVPASEADLSREPALRSEAASEELALHSLSLPSVQAEAATHATAAAELSLASQSALAGGAATAPPQGLLGAGLVLSPCSGQSSQQPAGRAAEEGPLGEPQGAALAQPHLGDETCSAELCMAVRSSQALPLPQQQAPDKPTGAPLEVPDIHATVAAQPGAQQELRTKGSMEAHCREPAEQPHQTEPVSSETPACFLSWPAT